MGTVVGLVFFVTVVYILIKIIPVFIAQYTFGERVREEALTAVTQYGGTEDAVRARMMKHAKENNIPIRAEDIRVILDGKNFTIDVRYTMVVEFPFYTWRSTENPKYTATRYN